MRKKMGSRFRLPSFFINIFLLTAFSIFKNKALYAIIILCHLLTLFNK